MNKKDTELGLPWHIVEKAIHQEINWLKEVIDIRDKEGTLSSSKEITKWATNYYLYRLIAILIISGKVKAKQIKSTDLWGNSFYPEIHRHGQDWHKKMMNIIDNYFRSQGYDIIVEPNLHQGRADLGVFKKDKKDLYVEVGTTDIYKLWLNLNFMQDFVLIIVPEENMVIEFEK